MPQRISPTSPPSYKQVALVLTGLITAAVFCVAVGVVRPQPECGLQVLLGICASIAAAVITPGHLPLNRKNRKNCLNAFGVLSDLAHAIPETELVRIDCRDETTPPDTAEPILLAQQTLVASEAHLPELTSTNL